MGGVHLKLGPLAPNPNPGLTRRRFCQVKRGKKNNFEGTGKEKKELCFFCPTRKDNKQSLLPFLVFKKVSAKLFSLFWTQKILRIFGSKKEGGGYFSCSGARKFLKGGIYPHQRGGGL